MSNRVRARETKTGEAIAYSEAAIRHNASAVEYCRTSMAALSGSTAGNCGKTRAWNAQSLKINLF